MIKTWIIRVYLTLATVAVSLLLLGAGFYLVRPAEIPLPEVRQEKTLLPKNAFVQHQDAYNAIGEPTFLLNYVAPQMQLPDLRQKLVYYGQNGRPDADRMHPFLHFSFLNGLEMGSMAPGTPLYLVYDKNKGGIYHFSPGNQETGLWIEATPDQKDALVKVKMRDDKGEIIETPETFAAFPLKEKEYVRQANAPWEIGKWRVDATLLARQKARWYGVDRFMEKHGGDEFKEAIGKNRIDFGDKEEEGYSLFVNEGTTLVWDGSVWKVVKPGTDSLGKPLLVVKKVEDRLMNLELWDPEGKKKVVLNLLKSIETWMPRNIQDEFKFLGARTRSQYVFDVDDEKMLLSPHDWLILTDGGWKKIDTPEEVDEYVARKETGPLFVFEGVIRKDDQQILKGTIYNSSRSAVHDVELPVQKDALVRSHIDKENERRKALRQQGIQKVMTKNVNGQRAIIKEPYKYNSASMVPDNPDQP